MSGCILSLDYGTTCMKGILYDQDFRVLSQTSWNFTYEYPAPNCIEYNAKGYVTAALEGMKTLLKEADVHELSALALTGQAETLICLDKNGEPVGNAYVWLDSRAQEEAAELKEKIGTDAFYRKTGILGFDPVMPLCKLPWIRRYEPERYEKIAKAVMLKDYLVYALTGVLCAEPSVSSCTGYLNIAEVQWDKELLAAADIDPRILPPICEQNSFVGELKREICEELGLRGKVPVNCGMIDQSASAVGSGNFGGDVLSETTGTVLAVAAILKEFQPEGSTMPVFCHGLPGVYMALPNCSTAGVLLKWYRDSFHSELAADLKGQGKNFFGHVDDVLLSRGMQNNELLVLPHFCGSQCPVANPAAKGVFYGLTLDTDRYDVAGALMESVGFLLRENLDNLRDNGLDAETVISLGGGANSDWWLQRKADITGKRICTLADGESTALGAAYGAAIAMGRIDKAGILEKRRIVKTFDPGAERARMEEKYQRYLELNRRLGFYPSKTF